jgi:hypothetical protein
MHVHDLIIECSNAFLAKQKKDGSFPAGHNGPYYDEELPVRNTSHVLILLLKAYAINGDDRYLKPAKHAAEYVADEARRPMGANFWSRKNPVRDFSNGLIGPAWVIEALTCASGYFDDLGLNKLAEDVFLLHPFNTQEGVWQSVNVDGSHGPVDNTFNHQLWFAAAGRMIEDSPVISSRVGIFMDHLDTNLRTYENGLIIHGLKPRRRLKQVVKDTLRFIRGHAYTNSTINKAIAYHAFNTYGFSLLFERTQDHAFWSSGKFKKILRFLESDLYVQGLDCFRKDNEPDGVTLPFSKYGYAYNPPGIEVTHTIQSFPEYFKVSPEEAAGWWLDRQLEKTFNRDTDLMEKNTDDPVTLASRIYELARLNNYRLMYP